MVRTRSDYIVLWPTYFDVRKTRAEGRRASKKYSIEKPTVEEVFKAVKSLGLTAHIKNDKSYPSNCCEREGMVRVEKSVSKTQLINKVAVKLKDNDVSRP